jgi:DNA-directed RNA polymerase beta subunit
MLKASSAELAESKTNKDKAEEPKIEGAKMLENLSPSVEVTVPKAQKSFAATPKRRRMANVLDVLETVKALSSTPSGKIVEASKMQTKAETKPTEVEAAISQASAEDGPSELTEKKPSEIEEKAIEEKASDQTSPEKVATPGPEALKESIDYIIRHASGKTLSKEEKREAQHYAQKLKYLKGALVFNGSGEEDFLYCLPDNKEISVSPEIGRSFGFLKLEDGLSVLSKDELADSLAYNSIKVWKSILYLKTNYFICLFLILYSSCRAWSLAMPSERRKISKMKGVQWLWTTFVQRWLN